MPEVAVFVRNHVQYLDRACEISAEDPSRPVTFRSSRKWASAKKALDEQVVIRAYLSPTGGDGQVLYSAIIKNIVLDPRKGWPCLEHICGRKEKTSKEYLKHNKPDARDGLRQRVHLRRYAFRIGEK